MSETLSPSSAYETPDAPERETGIEQGPSMQDVVKNSLENGVQGSRAKLTDVLKDAETKAEAPEVSEQTRTQLKSLSRAVTAAVTQSRAQIAEVEDLPENVAGQNSGEKIAVDEDMLVSGSTPAEVSANIRFVLRHEIFHKEGGHTEIVGGETKEGTALIEGKTVKSTGVRAEGGSMEVSDEYKGHVGTYDAAERKVGKQTMDEAFKKKDLTGVLQQLAT